ncbi:MAG: nucleoside-triphosphatase [Anaerolineales bacterium]
MSSINLLTGQIQSGKTSLCLAVSEAARERGLQLGGLISPAVFDGGNKTAIDVLDLKTSGRRRLAELKGNQASELETIRWSFLPEAIEWGNRALLKAVPCDLLIIDELGPLEFYQDEGWVNAFSILESGRFQAALLVVRPSLLEEACRRWDVTKIVDLEGSAQRLSPQLLVQQLVEG